jgi:hypothetical protein
LCSAVSLAARFAASLYGHHNMCWNLSELDFPSFVPELVERLDYLG